MLLETWVYKWLIGTLLSALGVLDPVGMTDHMVIPFFFFLICLFTLGPNLQHVDISTLGVKSVL